MFKSKIIRKYETSKNFPIQVNDHFLPMMLKISPLQWQKTD